MSAFPGGMSEKCQKRTSSIPGSVTKPPGRNLSLAVRVRRVVGRELIGTELDLNLFKRASKFEWHLRVVLVDDWRSVILTTARLRNSANLPMARSTLLSLIGALGFYHRRVFLPVLTRAFANFSLLSLLSPKMRSQSLLEFPLNPTWKRSWCSSVFGFGVAVDVGVDVGVVSSVIFVSLPTNGHYDFYKTWKSIPPDQTLPSLIVLRSRYSHVYGFRLSALWVLP